MKEEKSPVLAAAMIIIPMILIALAIWLWPQVRQAYNLPDSSVLTYQHALSNAVPPGTGRVTRTAIIERVLAAELGELSDAAAGANAAKLAQLRQVMHFNTQVGRWTAAVMTMPRSTRVNMFAWGVQKKILPVMNLAFSRWPADRISAARQLAKIPGVQETTTPKPPIAGTRLSGGPLVGGPLNSTSRFSDPQFAKAAMQKKMRAVSQAIAAVMNGHVSAQQANTAITAEYKTLIGVMAVMPWQRELRKIMSFNEAMSQWIYRIAQLPPARGQVIFNWARYRTQDVELMRMAMSRRRAQRLRAAGIAPKLHGVQRAWLVHRLLLDPSVTVELAMLHELWKLPSSPRLIKTVRTWVTLDPLPKGYDGTVPAGIEFYGHSYKVGRIVAVKRYQQARNSGAMLLSHWEK